MMKAVMEPNAYKGTAKSVVTAGRGTPMANPELKEVLHISGYEPNGISLVTAPGIAVAIDEKGFLSPADGADKVPFGIIGLPLRSTAHLKPFYSTSGGSTLGNEKDVTPAFANGMDDLHGVTPTVYQFEALFEKGYSFKSDGATKDIFDLKIGDLLRPIKSSEINTSINDDTLPVLFGESKSDCPKTKGYYAGMLVKFDGSADDHRMKCARVASVLDGDTYDNQVYTGNQCFQYNIQGKDTAGTGRHVWLSFESTYKNAAYTKKIVEFYATM